jgi:hypothetical protein
MLNCTVGIDMIYRATTLYSSIKKSATNRGDMPIPEKLFSIRYRYILDISLIHRATVIDSGLKDSTLNHWR